MKGVKKINLQWIKGLMLASHLLLMLFTAQWLYGQYNNQKEALKTNLAKLFTDVQHRVSDSLLLNNIIDPVTGKMASLNVESTSTSTAKLSPQGLHQILSKTSNISGTQEKSLFKMDTIAFNEIFASQ